MTSRWLLIGTVILFAVLLPFLVAGAQFERLGERIAAGELSSASAAGVVMLLLALDVFLPVPSSLVSTAAGALFGFVRGLFVIWIGMTAGCLIGYAVGARAVGAARRYVGDEGLARAARVAERYGDWGLAIARPVPVLAEASTVLAGLVRTSFGRFALITTLANLGISAAYAAVGAFSMGTGSFLLTFAGALVLPGIAMLMARRRLT